jgi:hypothetical protein
MWSTRPEKSLSVRKKRGKWSNSSCCSMLYNYWKKKKKEKNLFALVRSLRCGFLHTLFSQSLESLAKLFILHQTLSCIYIKDSQIFKITIYVSQRTNRTAKYIGHLDFLSVLPIGSMVFGNSVCSVKDNHSTWLSIIIYGTAQFFFLHKVSLINWLVTVPQWEIFCLVIGT